MMILPVQKKAVFWLLNFLLTGIGLNGQATFEMDTPNLERLFIIDTFQPEIPLKNYAEVLFDPNNEYQVADFLNKPQQEAWQPMEQFESSIFQSKEKPWIKIKLKNQLAGHQNWVLDCSYVNDSILAYIIRESGSIDTLKLGRLVKPGETNNGSTYLQKLYTPKHPIYLNLPQGEDVVVYLKFYTHFFERIYLNPRLQSPEKVTRHLLDLSKQYAKGFFYSGMVWMFLFYNFLIYIFYRARSNLYLALFALCFVSPGEYIVMTWMTKTWFPDFPYLIYVELAFLIPLIYVFIAFFIRAYLDTKNRFPRVDLYMKILAMIGFSYLTFSILLIFIEGGIQHAGIRILTDSVVLILAAIIFILMTIRIYKVKQTNVRFLILGCSFLLLCQLFAMTLSMLNSSNWIAAIQQLIYPISMADIGVLGLIAILTLGIGQQSRETFKEKELLEQKDHLKSRFYANISHEFRTPLTLILGPMQTLLDKTKDDKDRQMLEIMQRNAKRQMQLVNSLLSLSKLETGKMPFHPKAIEVVQFLKGILFSHETLAKQKSIHLNFQSQFDQLVLEIDPEKIEVIFYNLLSNAFRYTQAGDQIEILLKVINKQLQISVSDTGLGIAPQNLPKVFDRFFYTSEVRNEEENNGIGLALSLEFAKLHQGDIQVTSTLGEGSIFTVCLPMRKTNLSPIQITPKATSLIAEPKPVVHKKSEVVIPADQPTCLLLVEDNADVRQFIRKILEPYYEVVEAENGKKGLAAAIELDPKLIISDVMMPEMDGYELCQLLKSDLRTSHIPVILLTAKAAQAEKLEGLETGADDYLVKPFDTKELLVRIQNLLKLRQNLRQRFASSILLKPAEIKTNSLDKAFLEKAMAVLEDNMTNEDFNIEALATSMQTSKSTLNRKLRALLDQSANDFIRSVRLQRAADLLKQQAGTVSEIAFQTGFRSTAYFVKSFKDHFGVTPGNYEEK
ncbi:MAG: hypothetical protein Sapg2KO_01480 [Saprospiraceae bacterium]